jgi:hypothetical protein
LENLKKIGSKNGLWQTTSCPNFKHLLINVFDTSGRSGGLKEWTSFLRKVELTLLLSRFFPPKFSFVFWKREFFSRQISLFQNTKEKFGGKNLLSKRVNLLCKGVFASKNYQAKSYGYGNLPVKLAIDKGAKKRKYG